MRCKIMLLLSVIMYLMSVVGYAGVKEEYEQASRIYEAAGACMAAYSDRYGHLANRYLEQDGWEIEHYKQPNGNLDVRFLLAKKQLSNGEQMYVLAIVGTENVKHMKVDLKVDKVYFAGSNLEEFDVNAAKHGVPATEPKVHRGFHQFVQAGLATKTTDASGESKYLTDMLLANKERKIYLVGHSLGGAAATLAGARLISMGVSPEQIEIITFGAPAVGNAAFAAKFRPQLNLTRVVIAHDPVTGILQRLVGGYKQFGREVKWDLPDATDPHQMNVYGDLVIKNYYDKRQQALQAGSLPPLPSQAGIADRFYVAPLQNNLPDALVGEYWYMQQALWDEYRKVLPSYILSGENATDNLRERAEAAGCKWLVIPEVSAYKLKQEQNVYYITLHQTVYDVATGTAVKVASFSAGTFHMTPLEALIHNSRGINFSHND